MSILYTNADSLGNKIKELELLIDSLADRPTVIAITEVKSKAKNWNLKLSEFNLKGYNIISNDLDKYARGIIMYLDKNIEFSIIESSIAFQEYILLKIKMIDQSELILCVIYRSPNSTDENNKLLFEIFDYVNNLNKKVILVGDFNLS